MGLLHIDHRMTDWKLRAACLDAALDIFVSTGDELDEDPYPSIAALSYCDRCEVRALCLAYALDNQTLGTWGGTSYYQRRLLRRSRQRESCPGCGGMDLVQEHTHELCLACGVSWDIVILIAS